MPCSYLAFCDCSTMLSQKTRDVESMLTQCWARVVDDGPILNQHCVNASCLLGYHQHSKPEDTMRRSNVVLMFWSNIVDSWPTIKQHVVNVFAGKCFIHIKHNPKISSHCWVSVPNNGAKFSALGPRLVSSNNPQP